MDVPRLRPGAAAGPPCGAPSREGDLASLAQASGEDGALAHRGDLAVLDLDAPEEGRSPGAAAQGRGGRGDKEGAVRRVVAVPHMAVAVQHAAEAVARQE